MAWHTSGMHMRKLALLLLPVANSMRVRPMPPMQVAAFHSLVGLAAVCTSISAYLAGGTPWL